jgi:hypothetical protein
MSPQNVPVRPILFFEVRKGAFSLILQPAGLILFHRDLIDFLDKHSLGQFERYEALIRPPQSDKGSTDYFVVKFSNATPLAAIKEPAGRPAISVVKEVPGEVLVSTGLRRLLYRSPLTGFDFHDPIFV